MPASPLHHETVVHARIGPPRQEPCRRLEALGCGEKIRFHRGGFATELQCAKIVVRDAAVWVKKNRSLQEGLGRLGVSIDETTCFDREPLRLGRVEGTKVSGGWGGT